MKQTIEHRWELIHVTEEGVHFEYCVRCGVLSIDQREFWVPGDPALFTKNPVGSFKEPSCKEKTPTEELLCPPRKE
jgi:hypothetical protein